MGRVVLVSTSYKEQEELEEVYAAHKTNLFTFETTASFAQEASFWSAVDVLILHVPEDPVIQAAFLARLREKLPSTLRVIIMTAQMNTPILQLSQSLQRVRILKLPVNGYVLYRTLIDVTTDYPPGQQQAHPRYLTDLSIQVSSDLKSLQAEARLKNLSIGGAYFETALTAPPFASGDLIRLSIVMPGNKRYEFDAKIVWRRSQESPGVLGYGCAFLNKEQVYDSLLSHME